MIPQRFEPYLFGLILSGFMSLMVSGIATFRATGLVDGFGGLWISAWFPSWAVAYPALLVFSPIVRRFVGTLVRRD